MSQDAAAIREAWWRDGCPWLILFRVFGVAVSIHVLFLASVAVVVTSGIWRAADAVFPTQAADGTAAVTEEYRLANRCSLSRWPGHRCHAADCCRPNPLMEWAAREGVRLPPAPLDPVIGVPTQLALPLVRLFHRHRGWRENGYLFFGGLGSLLVWSLFGGAISRIAAMQLALHQRVRLHDALSHARLKFPAYVGAPLFSMAVIAGIALPMMALGWLMLTDFGIFVSGLLWFAVIVGGILMTIGAVGLLFGWPLMWGALGCECSDAFDAISRSYAYTFQRPLHFLFYALLAAALGTLGWLVVWGFSETVISITYWGASWGAGAERIETLVAVANSSTAGTLTEAGEEVGPSGMFSAGARCVAFNVATVRSVATGFSYSYFWCAATAIYLLLRLSTDATELDEVDVDVDEDTTLGLPELEGFENGVPGFSDNQQ